MGTLLKLLVLKQHLPVTAASHFMFGLRCFVLLAVFLKERYLIALRWKSAAAGEVAGRLASQHSVLTGKLRLFLLG